MSRDFRNLCQEKFLLTIRLINSILINVSHEGRTGLKTRVLVAFLLWR